MQVNYHPPSDLDAMVDAQGARLHIKPIFYQPKGTSVIGTLQVVDSRGTVLDRAVITVNGSGRINLTHRTEEVVPIADAKNGDKNDGGSTASDGSAGSTRSTSADAHAG